MSKQSPLWRILTGLFVWVSFGALACSNSVQAPTPFPQFTPDLTLEALISRGSATAPPAVTATPLASETATATATETPTPTPSRTPIPTQPGVELPATEPSPFTPAPTTQGRSGGVVQAVYLSSAVQLDGELNEWNLAYSAKDVTYGVSTWNGPADLSAAYAVGWDANYLYIAARVNDDVFRQGAAGAEMYKGDSLEILFDGQLSADFYVQALSPDDFQLGVSPGLNNQGELYVWYPQTVAGGRDSARIVYRAITGGYQMEAAIPWHVLEVQPSTGARYGFVLSLSDNDSTLENLQQCMVSAAAGRQLTDPTTWGELVLGK